MSVGKIFVYHVKQFFDVVNSGVGVFVIVENVVGSAMNDYRLGIYGINKSFRHVFPIGRGGCAYAHGNRVFTTVSRIEV